MHAKLIFLYKTGKTLNVCMTTLQLCNAAFTLSIKMLNNSLFSPTRSVGYNIFDFDYLADESTVKDTAC